MPARGTVGARDDGAGTGRGHRGTPDGPTGGYAGGRVPVSREIGRMSDAAPRAGGRPFG